MRHCYFGSRFAYLILFGLFLSANTLKACDQRINGFFYHGDITNPIPGALIALYGSNDNKLFDHTYTANDGSFSLGAPDIPGKFYLIATKGTESQRQEFDYNPQHLNKTITINSQISENQLTKALAWFFGKLDYTITAIVGFLLGFFVKFYENKKLFNFLKVQLEIVSCKVLDSYSDLKKIRNEIGLSSAIDTDKLREWYKLTIEQLNQDLKELEWNNKGNISVIYSIRGEQGIKQYFKLQHTIQKIDRLTHMKYDDFVRLSSDELNEPFNGLKENNLLNRRVESLTEKRT